MEKPKPTIFNIMKDPSILGGPDKYRNIVQERGYKQKYNQFVATHVTIPFIPYYLDNDRFLFHFNVPSLSDERMSYDVVLEFYVKESKVKGDDSLVNYSMKFFSNSPGFTFNFAYVYNKYGLLIEELKDKFDGKVLQEPPTRNNPTSAIGFDYTMFFCMRFLYMNDFYLKKSDIKRRGKKLEEFSPDNVIDCYEALEKRQGESLNFITKMKRTAEKHLKNTGKTISNIPRHIASAIAEPLNGIVKGVKSVKTIIPTRKATKSVKVIRPKGKRR